MNTIEIFECDQWSASQVQKQKLSILDLKRTDNEVFGGDADSVRVIFGGGHVYRMEVDESRSPSIGYVWFKPDVKGVLQVYKTNYDSSD